MANENFTTKFIHHLYSEEGKNMFTSRLNVLGHMQQGARPTPFDRNLGTKMAAKAADWIITQIKTNIQSDGTIKCSDQNTACLLGLIRRQYRFSPVQSLKTETDYT